MPVPPKVGPIGKALLRGIRAVQKAKVVDLQAVRAGTAAAAEMWSTVAKPNDLATLHPAHALYVHVQNQLSVLVEQVTAHPATGPFADRIEAMEEEYMPSGPPMSPLTTSYFSGRVYYDLAIGKQRETLADCVIAVGRALSMHPNFLALVERMRASRMGVYASEGVDARGRCVLRDLLTDQRMTCHVASGWRGAPGELWLVRLMPPPHEELDLWTVFTTPYVLQRASEADWKAYFDRVLGSAKAHAEQAHAAVKYDIDWDEYIFASYVGHVTEAIFLTGIPDIPASLPHYSPHRT